MHAFYAKSWALPFCFLVVFCALTAAKIKNYKSCQTNNLPTGCPNNTSCEQIDGNESREGECHCLRGFTFNEKYASDDDYCLNNATEKPEEQLTEVQTEHVPDPGAHGFGSIVVPLIVVASFVGLIFAIRRYELIQRFRSLMRERRSNPYRDVINSREFDDPLLI